jgi:hypothetical protein
MGLGKVKRTTIYTRDAALRPPSHMTLIGKVLCSSEPSNEVDNQIPGDLACKTGAVGTARQSCGFSIAFM